MSASKKNKSNSKSNSTVEVLYQKMGDRWFAFSLIDDEVFVGSIAQDDLDTILPEEAKQNPSGHELG